MYKFLEVYSLPRSNHEEIKYLNRPITNKEIESVFKNLPTKHSPEPNAFTENSSKTLEELTPILLKENCQLIL
jgi:hypothetical protein